jgi:hypothetical protein
MSKLTPEEFIVLDSTPSYMKFKFSDGKGDLSEFQYSLFLMKSYAEYLSKPELSGEDQSDEDLRELKAWFGSWDDVRARIDELEEGDHEQAFEAKYSH